MHLAPSIPLVDVPVAGRLLGLSRAAIYRRVKEGSVPVLQGAGRKKVIVARLAEMIGRDFSPAEIEAACAVKKVATTGGHNRKSQSHEQSKRTA